MRQFKNIRKENDMYTEKRMLTNAHHKHRDRGARRRREDESG